MFLKHFCVVSSVVAVCCLLLYSFLITQRIGILQARMIAAEVLAKAHEQTQDGQQAAFAQRLTVLERAVFGVKPPPPVSAVETWQKNRDKALQDRLNALERWRLSQDGKDGKR